MYHSSINHHFASSRQKFIIFTQAAIVTKPRIGSFHYPSLGNNGKTGLLVSALKVFQIPAKILRNLGNKILASKSAIDPNYLQTELELSKKGRFGHLSGLYRMLVLSFWGLR
jgi:hypothetical protein